MYSCRLQIQGSRPVETSIDDERADAAGIDGQHRGRADAPEDSLKILGKLVKKSTAFKTVRGDIGESARALLIHVKQQDAWNERN